MTASLPEPVIRPACPTDGPAYVELVRGLAAFEGLAPPDDMAALRLLDHAFGAKPRYELLVVELDGRLVGYAAFFETYSTFRALPSLYLEDLFVLPEARGRGIGRGLMLRLAGLAVERGSGRFEWCVLDWNAGAQRFYRSLGSSIHTEWHLCRVDGDALLALADRPDPTP